jgi:hypothetical protein
MRPRALTPLVAIVLVAACGEPTRVAAPAPGELPPGPLAALRPVFQDEAARLMPSFGTRQAEQPLRLALRTLGERAHQPDVSALVRDAGGLLDSYRHARDAAVDPADVDAVHLLIAAADEAIRRPQ